jgi:ribosomal-protein-alanine N-acetyltransferase
MILELKRLPILETERLRLEPLTEDDVGNMFPIMGAPDVMAYWDMPETDDPDLLAEVVKGQVEDMRTARAMHWGMRTLAGDEFLGCCDLTEIDRRHRRAEVGFILGRDASGQGYALEAMRTVIAFAATHGLRKLVARTHLGARRSEELLEKLGFTQEGLLRGHILKDGERRDCLVYGLLL